MKIIFIPKEYVANFFALIESYVVGSTEALDFAQTKLSPFGKDGQYTEKLQVSLLFA